MLDGFSGIAVWALNFDFKIFWAVGKKLVVPWHTRYTGYHISLSVLHMFILIFYGYFASKWLAMAAHRWKSINFRVLGTCELHFADVQSV